MDIGVLGTCQYRTEVRACAFLFSPDNGVCVCLCASVHLGRVCPTSAHQALLGANGPSKRQKLRLGGAV